MKLDYTTLKSAPDDISIIVMFKFLVKTKNARLRPGEIGSDCPPVLFWWFEENNKEVNQFIANAVKNFPWEVSWTLEDVGNNKWLLYPSKLKEVEKKLKGKEDVVSVTTDSVGWLMNDDPDFGRRANKDLDLFRVYFRAKIESYLKKKEQREQGFFK